MNPDESLIINRLMDIGKQLNDAKSEYDKELVKTLMQERYHVMFQFTTHIHVSKWKLWCAKIRHQLPTQNTKDQWIHAYNLDYEMPYCPPTPPDDRVNGGKWLIFVPIKHIDKIWLCIKEATEKGLLGVSAKCATMKPSPNASWKDKVVCVYTDSLDDLDIFTLRYRLLELGFHKLLPFKTNQATREGKYWVNGDREISLYRI